MHTISTTQPRHRDLHQYNTRHAGNFALPQHHLSLSEQRPTYKDPPTKVPSSSTTQPRHRDLHQYNTRHAVNFSLPQHHLSLSEQRPTYKGALFFNNAAET
ncbi:hypothetical protein J6590_061813 [Homalodisca vitripennis]|nr:hypothetical protein J6590_061813 [Homalodisca vitripennis]